MFASASELRIPASALVGKSIEELDYLLSGHFTLVCEDGEVEVHAKDVMLSSFAWRLDIQYNGSRIKKNRVISAGKFVGKENRLMKTSISDFLGMIVQEINEGNRGRMTEDARINRLYEPGGITDTNNQIINQIYNEMTLFCEEYAGSMDIIDVIEVLEHPDMIEAHENVQPTQDSIDEIERVVDRVLKDPAKGLYHNPVSKSYRSKLVSGKQAHQILGVRGFCTDSDSMIFSKPIMRGYANGIRSFSDSLIESRSAAKSLTLAKADLQDAEYFSRRLQLLVQGVENLHRGDCGSTNYLLWNIRPRKEIDGSVYHPGDFDNILGVNILKDDGSVGPITERDTHLIGKTVKMRSVFKCDHPDPVGVCSTCYGALSDAISPDSNFGHINTVSVTQKSSQSVLSVKHLDGSSVIERILLGTIESKYLAVADDGNSYMLQENLKDMKPRLVIPADKVRNITDVDEVDDMDVLTPRHVSEMASIHLEYSVKTKSGLEAVRVGLNVTVRPRLASFTTDMLAHVKKHRWEIGSNGDYVFDMSQWDFSKAFLELPLRHFNMSDHSKDIARLIESRKEKQMEREKVISPDQHLVDVFDLVNTKLSVNLAPLSVIVYGSMIRSASRYDYALPKAHTTAALGVSSSTMLFRSLAALMAFQEHHAAITAPMSYLLKNRAEHLFDAVLCPREVQHYGTRTR